MLNKNFLLTGSIIFMGISILIGSYNFGNAIKSIDMEDSVQTPFEDRVLNLSQVANYLNMTEEEVLGIIQTEENILKKTSSFQGKMFPNFTVNNKKYFYKDEIDEWLKEVSSNRKIYNITEGWIL